MDYILMNETLFFALALEHGFPKDELLKQKVRESQAFQNTHLI